MYDILDSFDISADFFKVNQQLAIMFPGIDSSTMWAITLIYHPQSKFRNVSFPERKKIIEEDYLLKELDIEDEKIAKAIEVFNKHCLTKKQQFLNNWERKLEEREEFIGNIEYNANTYELLDKMMASTQKLWQQYFQCLKDVNEEASTYVTGNSIESLSESGEI